MRTSSLLAVVFLASQANAVDPLAAQFYNFLGELLGDFNDDSWSLSYRLSNYQVDLVVASDGWISLRQGKLYNLSSWSRSQDSTVRCDAKNTVVTANISFEPLQFSFEYYVDNGTVLSPARDLKGAISGMSAQLEVTQNLGKNSSSKATFRLLPTENVTSVVGLEDQIIAENISNALRRGINEDILPRLQKHVGNIIEVSLSREVIDVSSLLCGTTATATSKMPQFTTETTSYSTYQTKTTSLPAGTINATVTSTAKRTITAKRTTTAKSGNVKGNTDARFNNPDQNDYKLSEQSASVRTKVLNKFVDDLLRNVGENFPSEKLEPYHTPDSDEEIDKVAESSVMLVGNVTSSYNIVTLNGDPEVLRRSGSVMVKAELLFREAVEYDFYFNISSNSPGDIHGKWNNLKGQLIIEANVDNSSIARTSLERFLMTPTVNFVSTSLNAYNVTEDEELGILDAVRGVFKKEFVPFFSNLVTPILRKALEGKMLNVSETLPTTTSAPTTTTTTTTTSTTTTTTTPRPTVPATNKITATATTTTNSPETITAALSTTVTSTNNTAAVASDNTAISHESSTVATDITTSAVSVPSSSSTIGSGYSYNLNQPWLVVLTAHILLLLTTNTFMTII